MNKLTWEEVRQHRVKIKLIRQRTVRAKEKYCNGDITIKKLRAIEKEVKQEEAEYIKSSGVILYFGELFRAAV